MKWPKHKYAFRICIHFQKSADVNYMSKTAHETTKNDLKDTGREDAN